MAATAAAPRWPCGSGPSGRAALGVMTFARNDPVPAATKNSAVVPRPATAWVSLCRTITNTSMVLMPSTIRCAASPERVAATVGTASTVRAPCSHPVATA